MFKKYSPLICHTTGCDHWISEYLECYLTAKVIGHLGFHHGISSFKITDGEREKKGSKSKFIMSTDFTSTGVSATVALLKTSDNILICSEYSLFDPSESSTSVPLRK